MFDVLSSNYEGIIALYQMMMSEEPVMAAASEKDGSVSSTKEKLKEMMNDPKYWCDHDPDYTAKIESGFKRLYADQENE